MELFDNAFAELLGNEGAYSNNPNDPGGETMWGITKRVADAWGYKGRMRELPVETAKLIYKKKYWSPYFDQLPYAVAFNVFDASVNHGMRTGVKMLQRAVGSHDDGYMGPNTISAAMSMNAYKVLLNFNSERLYFYTNLKTFKHFGKGWTNRVAHNLKVE